jgi:hypothetical protein
MDFHANWNYFKLLFSHAYNLYQKLKSKQSGYLQGYLGSLCGQGCNNISRETNSPMRFVFLVSEHGLLGVESFSGRCYLSKPHMRL